MLKLIKLQSVSAFFALTVMGLPLTASAQEISAVSPSVINVAGLATGTRGSQRVIGVNNYTVQLLLWREAPRWSNSWWFLAEEAFPHVVPDIYVTCESEGRVVSRRMTTWRVDWDTGISAAGLFPPAITCRYSAGTLTNNTANAYDGYYVGFVIGIGNDYTAGGAGKLTIPARKECSASMNDLPLGTLLAGDSRSVQWPYTTNGIIELTGSHLSQSGTLMLGGRGGIEIRPTNNMYLKQNGAATSWLAPKGSNAIPLSAKVDRHQLEGTYSSTLTATLSCD